MPRVARMVPEDGLDQLISQNIIKCRKLSGLTQQQLADKIGMSRSGLADIELGRNKVYGETVARIAAALGVSTDELLGANTQNAHDSLPSLRFTRRLRDLDQLPEAKKKAILKTLDDLIRANS